MAGIPEAIAFDAARCGDINAWIPAGGVIVGGPEGF